MLETKDRNLRRKVEQRICKQKADIIESKTNAWNRVGLIHIQSINNNIGWKKMTGEKLSAQRNAV